MRLDTISPELVTLLRNSSPEKQRFVSLLACKEVLMLNDVYDINVLSFIDHIGRNSSLSKEERNLLESLVSDLDDKYFDLQENPKDENSINNSMVFFGQARAISALSFAGIEDPFSAAAESIYEASMAVDDGNLILSLVKSALAK
jgi:hypothetical protein